MRTPLPIPVRSIVDGYSIFTRREPRDLAEAYAFYCGKKLTNAHNAEADVSATQAVFLAQMQRYQDLGPQPQTSTRNVASQKT